MNPILGQTNKHWISTMFGTDYMQFQSPIGVGGLAKERNESWLDVLAVHSDNPGSGQFREFIKLCKEEYKTVCFWVDMNPDLGKILTRYGFTPEVDVLGSGETVDGWRWDKKQ
jgi:hypothetical protein